MADSTTLPIVRIQDGRTVADSRDVARYFKKQHNNVLRDIETLLAHRSDLSGVYFQGFTVEHPTVKGRKDPAFEMTKDGFTLLAMGFNGAKALEFKIRYIAEFNRMEAELRSQAEGGTLNLDEASRAVVGGIMKSVVTKAIAESEARQMAAFDQRLIEVATPMQRGLLALADRVQTLASPSGRHKTSVDYRAAVDVLDDFGVPQKGRGGPVRSVSSQLDGFSRREGVAVRAEASTGKRLFHVDIIDRWLKEGGAQVIHKILADLTNRQAAGQREMSFPPPEPPKPPRKRRPRPS